uniref:Uncharacterized protein n=1 Tax=Panagrolaimus sp. PS1159 TaxID=55785 RepID=A0AC35F2Y9_9BILA
MFKGDEGITGDVIIAKNLSDGSNGIQEKEVAVEILSSRKIYNSDQRGFVIVFSTETNKFWAIKQQNVPLSIEEFEKIFDSQKLLFEKRSYRQVFSNIINEISEKAVSKIEKKITTRTPLFDSFYERKKLMTWDIVSPDKYPPLKKVEKIEKIETHSFFQNFIVFSLVFLSCIFIFIAFISFARRQIFRSTAEMEENIRNTLEVDTPESATSLCPMKPPENNNSCPPPPSYSEAVASRDKFWDGFVAASRLMHTIQSYDRARIDAPVEYFPDILIQYERNEINPSAPVEDKNE